MLKQKMTGLLTQAETEYIEVSPEADEACAGCRWFLPATDTEPSACYIVEPEPAPIVAEGYCNRHEAESEDEPADEAEELVEEIVSEAAVEDDETDKAGRVISSATARSLKNAWQALKDLFTKTGILKDMDTEDDEPDDEKRSTFKVFKVGNKLYWKAEWSNAFEDREGEILSEEAHVGYLKRVEEGLVPYPELWFYHVKGTVHGKAIWLGGVDKMMVAVGIFDDSPITKKFIRYYRTTDEPLGVSHGFKFPVWSKKGGVYTSYNTFEISPLPLEAAANVYTSFEELKMQITEQQVAALEKIVGKDTAKQIVSEAAKHSKALVEADVAYKDFADLTETPDGEETGMSVVGKTMLTLIEAQGQLAKHQADMQKAWQQKFEAQELANKKLADANATLQEAMKLTPRASVSSNTVINDSTLQERIDEKATDSDEFWKETAGVRVPKEKVGNNG